jgi:hypothetical protein
MKEKQLADMKKLLAQIEADLMNTEIELGDQEIFVIQMAAKLRKKIALLEK